MLIRDELEVGDPTGVQGERVCVPHPDWSWAAEEPITHVKNLQVLDGECT